jgi:hypothetical protein
MAAPRLDVAARCIGVGFLLLAIASIINLADLGAGVFESGWRVTLEFLLDPAAAIFTLIGWLFLVRVQAADTTQRNLLAAAYGTFGLRFAVLAISQYARATNLQFFSRDMAPFWLTALGYSVIAVGFLAGALGLRSLVDAPDPSGTASPARHATSRLIVAGYATIAVASLIGLSSNVTNGFFPDSDLRDQIQVFAQPLAAVVEVVAWWFLSRVIVRSVAQRYFLSKAFLALGLAIGADALAQLLSLTQIAHIGLSTAGTAQIWFGAVGSGVAAVGLILTSQYDGVQTSSSPQAAPARG